MYCHAVLNTYVIIKKTKKVNYLVLVLNDLSLISLTYQFQNFKKKKNGLPPTFLTQYNIT